MKGISFLKKEERRGGGRDRGRRSREEQKVNYVYIFKRLHILR